MSASRVCRARSRVPVWQRVTVAFSLRPEHLGPEAGRDGGVVLGLAGQGAEDRARVGGGQEYGELAEVIAQVAAEVAVTRGGEMLVSVGDQGIEQDVALGAPPTVNGLLGHSSAGGDALDRHTCQPVLDEQVIGRLQDCYPRRLAAPVPVPAVARGPGASCC